MRPRYPWRPYVLRSFFDTQLLLAESKGKFNHSFRQFVMGHRGDIEHRYTTSKGSLPQELMESLRSSFKQAEPFLTGRGQEETVVFDIYHQLLTKMAIENGEDPAIILQGWDNMPPEKRVELLADFFSGRSGKPAPASTPKQAQEQTAGQEVIIEADQLGDYLAQGWGFVHEIKQEGQPSRFVVRRK